MTHSLGKSYLNKKLRRELLQMGNKIYTAKESSSEQISNSEKSRRGNINKSQEYRRSDEEDDQASSDSHSNSNISNLGNQKKPAKEVDDKASQSQEGYRRVHIGIDDDLDEPKEWQVYTKAF